MKVTLDNVNDLDIDTLRLNSSKLEELGFSRDVISQMDDTTYRTNYILALEADEAGDADDVGETGRGGWSGEDIVEEIQM